MMFSFLPCIARLGTQAGATAM